MNNQKKMINKKLSRHRKDSIFAYVCLTPAFLGLTFLTYGPLIAVFIIGFFRWRGFSEPSFVGLANYLRLFTEDPYFFESIRVTVVFSLWAVIGSMFYSLYVAMLLNRKIPARGVFRALFYLPYILPATAVYIGWSWLYETNFGLFNYLFNLVGINNVMFLADSKSALPSLALIAVWLSGNLIVIFLAGLQNVPRNIHEAAEIDGANSWQRFRNVTVPFMSPIIFYNLLMSLIVNMQIIVPALALTGGGPGKSTTFISYLMYRYAFKSNRIGYASTISAMFFLLIAIFTFILFKTSRKHIFYAGGDGR